jgi:Peptide N-acetyl-beta-D-glucosaminyl asparaginase amidase A
MHIADVKIQAASKGNERAMAMSTTPSNPTTADPPVPVPNEAPCTVQLFSNFQFTNFTYPTFQYTPPANCPGPWAKVVLHANFNVTAGIQFDRTGSIWIDGTNIYFGTTAEPAPGYSPTWQIQKDVTDDTPILESPSTGEVVLGNIVNSTYTGVISASATLSFYPVSPAYPAANAPSYVYPLSGGPLGDNQYIDTPSQPLTTTITLPQNVTAAYLDVYLQSQIGDEFWYTCWPTNLNTELDNINCGSTAFREGDVSIDGQAAGVVPVYPWIYTGGIDLYLWQPIPGVETLNFKPYRVNLTPFAGVLDDGNPHTINVYVYNNGNYFAANGTLMIYTDPLQKVDTGGIISNTTALDPSPVVTQNVKINSQGFGSGRIDVSATHVVNIDGYVVTSSGRVETRINQTFRFDNKQQIDANTAETVFDQTISQDTNEHSMTTTITGNGPPSVVNEQRDYPLSIVYAFNENTSNGNETQYTSVSQGKTVEQEGDLPGWFGSNLTSSSNSVQASDFLSYDASTGTLGSKPQTTQTESIHSSHHGFCWNKTVSAKNGVLTAQMGGPC